jgi:hypothetical protein
MKQDETFLIKLYFLRKIFFFHFFFLCVESERNNDFSLNSIKNCVGKFYEAKNYCVQCGKGKISVENYRLYEKIGKV